MEMYWARVTATNDGGDGPPEELEKYIIAMPRPGMRIKDIIGLIRFASALFVTLNLNFWLKL